MKNNYNVFSILKQEKDIILKLREQGLNYKQLAKRFKVDLWAMESFVKGIEVNRVSNILDELKQKRNT